MALLQTIGKDFSGDLIVKLIFVDSIESLSVTIPSENNETTIEDSVNTNTNKEKSQGDLTINMKTNSSIDIKGDEGDNIFIVFDDFGNKIVQTKNLVAVIDSLVEVLSSENPDEEFYDYYNDDNDDNDSNKKNTSPD